MDRFDEWNAAIENARRQPPVVEGRVVRRFRALIALVNGFWSGLPWCCVKLFSMRVMRGENTNPDWPKWDDVPYVRCPDCVWRNRAVKMRMNGALPWDFRKGAAQEASDRYYAECTSGGFAAVPPGQLEGR